MTFHTQVVGANGQRQAMFIERVEGLAGWVLAELQPEPPHRMIVLSARGRAGGLAESILAKFEPEPPDVMIVFSVGGLPAVPIEIAQGARLRGLPVIAVTSVEQSLASSPVHSSGTRLLDHADIVIDLCTPPGDALVRIAGLETPVAPGSTIAGVGIANELKARTAALLVERGAMPPVLTSAALVGRERSDQLFDQAYADHARRTGGGLRGARVM